MEWMYCVLRGNTSALERLTSTPKNVSESPSAQTTNDNKPKLPPMDLKEHFDSMFVMNMTGDNCIYAPICHQTMKLLKLSPAGRLTT